jgi:non-heme Fe2+,alpha-ketoglutarate-dependent halogenase
MSATDNFPGRDLSFVPASTKNPSTLSSKQVAQYNERGYLFPFDAYSPADADQNRAYFDQLIAKVQQLDPKKNAYAINGYHTRCQGIYELATHPTILDHVEDLIGPNVIAWGTHYFCKMPHDPKAVPWHQDASYWPLTPSRTVTAWIAIDDADEENAAMQVIPGTHDKGHLDWQEADVPAVLGQSIVGIEDMGEPVSLSMKAGQFSLHADMIAHGSKPNQSDRRRCGLTVRYCPPQVTAPKAPSWLHNAILCRGKCDNPAWAFPSKPAGDNIDPNNRPKTIGGN